MGMPMSLEEDVRALKERVAYLDGWREGEANRYARLEADMAQVKEELHRLGDKIAAQDERLTARIEALDERLTARIEALDERLSGRIDAMGHRIEALDERLTARIETLDERLSDRIDAMGARIDRMMWFMLATLGGVLTNLVLTVLK